MQQKIKIQPITAELYPSFYEMVQASQWGNPMLPNTYQSSLWGEVLVEDNRVIGGWVGTMRGNIPIAKMITKSVYFDSYPIFATDEMKNLYQDSLITSMKLRAAREGITMFNLTHWVRGRGMQVDIREKCATFTYDLSLSVDDIYAKLDRLKRRTIKKSEANSFEIRFLHKHNALPYIDEFLQLRQVTQKRAIQHNARASMLLKSAEFFNKLFIDYDTTLVAIKVENKLVAAATFIIAGNTVYAHMSGSDSVYNKSMGTGTYYYWAAVKYFKERGLKVFDFGGSPITPEETHPAYGVYSFKKGFGGEYQEFDGGKIIISHWKYKLLNWLLSQRKVLRFFSTKL